MTSQALYRDDHETQQQTAAAAVASGDVLQLADGRAAVYAGLKGAAAGEPIALRKVGIFEFAAATGAWLLGDEIWWDASAAKAVKKSHALDGAADFRLGIAVAAKGSSAATGTVDLNAVRPAADPVVFEFDCAGNNTPHVLLPASANPNGLLILGIYGIVSQVFAGDSQDQGVVTVEDTDGTDLTTITVADAGADIVGDVRLGYKIDGATAGDAGKFVAAGKGIQGFVSTPTSGAGAAGKLKVYIHAIPLV